MKTALLFAIALTGSGVTLPVAADDYIRGSYLHNALLQVCRETANDDRLGLRKTLNVYHVSKQAAVENVVCNGQPLMDFARANQAVKITAMLQYYEDRVKSRETIQDIAKSAEN